MKQLCGSLGNGSEFGVAVRLEVKFSSCKLIGGR